MELSTGASIVVIGALWLLGCHVRDCSTNSQGTLLEQENKKKMYRIFYSETPPSDIRKLGDSIHGQLMYVDYADFAKRVWDKGWIFLPCAEYLGYGLYYFIKRESVESGLTYSLSRY